MRCPTLAFGNYLVPASVAARTYVCDEHELVRRPPTEAGMRRRWC